MTLTVLKVASSYSTARKNIGNSTAVQTTETSIKDKVRPISPHPNVGSPLLTLMIIIIFLPAAFFKKCYSSTMPVRGTGRLWSVAKLNKGIPRIENLWCDRGNGNKSVMQAPHDVQYHLIYVYLFIWNVVWTYNLIIVSLILYRPMHIIVFTQTFFEFQSLLPFSTHILVHVRIRVVINNNNS